MKLVIKVAGVCVGVVALVIAAILAFGHFRFTKSASVQYSPPQFSIKEEVAKADVSLGKRIYGVRSGCIDCHGENLAGVVVMDNGAMGSIRGANLTPHNLQGWSDEEIAAAIRYGIHKSGRSLRFMPSFDYEKMSKSDIAALVAYIRSVEPVVTEPLMNRFGPVAKMLSSFGQMPVMFPAMVIDARLGFSEKPEERPDREFGRYLAHSCAGCHGPDFAGGKIPGGDPSWPEASSLRFGADSFWSEERFRQVIATGNSIRTGQPLKAPMPVALLKQMNETEIKALWEFFSSLD